MRMKNTPTKTQLKLCNCKDKDAMEGAGKRQVKYLWVPPMSGWGGQELT
jgi:hypothetical protein